MNKLFKDFDWKNGTFNDAQLNYLKLFAQNQIDIYLNGRTDEAIAEKHLKAVYKQLGKREPRIVWYDSPIAMVTSVENSVRDSVRNSVWNSVWNSVRDSVGDSVREWLYANSNSFYKFFSEEFEHNALYDYCRYSEQVNGGILSADVAHLVRKPIRLVRNADGRLHYDHDKAIEWADGTGFYYLNGVEFNEEQWRVVVEERLTLTDLAKDTYNLSDDQRVAAIQMLRPDRLLKQLNAKLIDTGTRGVELYEVPNFMDSGETEYCVKMQHPSIPKRYYIEWVLPEYGKRGSADKWMAFSRSLPLEDYLNAQIA